MPTRKDLANAIRFLSMDAVQKAKSGHPGMPLGMADIAEVLWNDFLKHNPADPSWVDRDRFVLSNGHGSMLLYSLLHLTGYNLSMEDIQDFRQLGSKTPGHPECDVTPGVETTTGPLGQGIANAVGMALAEKLLADAFNRDEFDVIDHHTYVFMGDGCMMEGISHEACSLAGTLQLGKLIAFYDDNGISIDGKTPGWFTEDIPARFKAYGWHVVSNVDGHDSKAIKRAIKKAQAATTKPSLICCKTIIGHGAPGVEGSEKCHGAPLGAETIAKARETLKWKYEPFVIPEAIHNAWDARPQGAEAQEAWTKKLSAYSRAHPELANELWRRTAGKLPLNWEELSEGIVHDTAEKGESLATRQSSQKSIEAFAALLPEMIGGSADLTGSNLTNWSGSRPVTAASPENPEDTANYIYYGVREFGMGAIMNGLALHGGFLPYGGTFLVFSDYARNAIRMAALIKTRVVWVLTHDSIGLGEDGPTHQSVEHISSMRIIPNVSVWRPCDAVETAASWKAAIERKDGPTVLALSRQTTPHIKRYEDTVKEIDRGGYVIMESPGKPEAVIIASGSEVGLALDAAELLTSKGRLIRVVSMPCMELFDAQDQKYKDSVLPPKLRARVAVEAGVTALWRKYTGDKGRIVGLDRFGESAPGPVLFKHFNFTAEHVAEVVEEVLAGK